MKILITEKSYLFSKLGEISRGQARVRGIKMRNVVDRYNFPNGSIMVYSGEKRSGFFHVEAWKYNLGPKTPFSDGNFHQNLIKIERSEEYKKKFEIIGASGTDLNDSAFLYLSQEEHVIFMESRKDILKTELDLALKLINNDLRKRIRSPKNNDWRYGNL